MTTVSDYLALVTSEHGDKPGFMAAVSAALQPFIDDLSSVASFPSKYDVDAAVGEQLDIVGQWVGLSRKLSVQIPNTYFSFDISGVGFDQGVWFAPFDPVSGIVDLDDTTYRFMLLAKILTNVWDGSMDSLQAIMAAIFAGSSGTFACAVDNFDMTITIFIGGTVPSAILQSLIVEDYIPFRPAAVLLKSVFVTTADAPLLALDVETSYFAGLDVGAWAAQIL